MPVNGLAGAMGLASAAGAEGTGDLPAGWVCGSGLGGSRRSGVGLEFCAPFMWGVGAAEGRGATRGSRRCRLAAGSSVP